MNKKTVPKKEMEKLEERQRELRERTYRLGDLCVGTIQERWLPCGKPNCRCKKEKGKKHGPYYYLAYTRIEDRKTSPVCISKCEVPGLRMRIKNFKKLECEVRELLDLEFRSKKHRKK